MSAENQMQGRLLVKPHEAARMLSISARKLWSLKASREIECVRIGLSVRYSVSALQAWVESQKGQG